MLKDISLKYKMILGGVIAVVIPFTIAGIIIYVQLSNSLLEMAKEKSVHMAQDVSHIVEVTLRQEIKLASAIASDPDIVDAVYSGEYQKAENELKAIHERIGTKYSTLFLADQRGVIGADAVFSQQIGVNISNRSYFLNAKKGIANVAGPFAAKGSATPERPIIVVCAPVEQNGKFYGLLALPFDMGFVVKTITRERLDDHGHAYLINDDGLILAHPRETFILKYNLFDQSNAKELAKIVLSKKTGAAAYRFEGYEWIAGVAPIPLTGWNAVFAESKDEIVAPVNRLLFTILVSVSLFLAVTILFIIIIFDRLSAPLQKTMHMMKQVTRHSKESILEIGPDRKITFANPSYEKIAGLRGEMIIGSEPNLENLKRVSPESIWDSVEKGIPWSGRLLFEGNGADAVVLDAMLLPLQNDRGTINGYLEIGRDVTEELKSEKRLQQAQKLESIGTLAGGIAHDFNNVLSGILGYSELCLMERGLTAKTEAYIGEIIKASERARDLVQQILTFSRQTDLALRPLLPKTIIKEALKLLRASTPAMINIESKINSDSAIMAEPTQLHQVVMNLFTNAVHAIGESVGTVKLELEDFMVDEAFTRMHPGMTEGKHVVIRISDTGDGIAPENKNRLFEPFFTTKDQGKGTGLGLSVVHGIVKDLNGIVTVYSEVGKGSVFNVIIPCLKTDVSELRQEEAFILKGTERIAFVDDEIAIVETMTSALESFGYRVTAFSDSTAALNAIRTNPNAFDMLITDYSMPELTGLEMTKKLRESDINIPVILVSGYILEGMESAAREIKISEVVTKPIRIHHLSVAMRRALGKNGHLTSLDVKLF